MRRRWPVLLFMDIAVSCALSLVYVMMLPWYQGHDAALLFPVVVWALKPALAFGITLCVTRAGLNGYAAMSLPFFCFNIIHYVLLGYGAAPGAEVLCLLTALLGAATGETIKAHRQSPKGRNRR